MAVLKDLIVHGASRFLNRTFFNTINAESIGASKGVFNKLVATNLDAKEAAIDNLTANEAKIIGILDVQGELHTNKWTNSNISNIGGSFYISPTVSTNVATGNTPMSITIGGSVGARTFAVGDGSFATSTVKIYENDTTHPVYSSGTTPGWPIGSHVMVTGSVRISTTGIDYPLGTLTGYLTGALTANGFTVGSINSTALESIISEIGTSNWKSYEISISMFEIGPRGANTLKPVGIMMTSYGVDESTYIDVYGGVKTKSVDNESGVTDPSVRIGYLGGLPSYVDSANNTRTPRGWGIYTDNGYFKGVVVADSGSIGGWTIGSNYITTNKNRNTYNSTTNTGMTLSYNGSSGGIGAYNSADQNFTLSSNGILTATGANIQGIITAKNFSALDNSGNIVAQLSDTLTIGQTTNNKFNIKITDTVNTEDISNRGPGVLLRKGTMVLNEINENGMKIYSAYTSSDTNLVQGDVIASFGVNATNHITECQIGSSQSRHFYINPDEFGFYSNNASYGKIDFVLKQKDNVKEDGYYTWDSFSGSNYQYTIPINTYQDLSNSIQISGKIIYDVGDGSSTYTFSCTPNGQFVSYVDNEAFMLLAGVFGKSSSGGNPKPESNDVGVSITPNSGYQFTALEVNFTVTYSTYWQGPHYNFGKDVNSIGQYSFAMGDNTIAREDCQLVAGKFNNPTDDALFVIGNGTDSNNRSNLMVVGDNEIRVGNINQSHLTLDYHSMQLIDKEGTTYFHVSDLRGQDGLVTLTETFHGDGKKKTFSVQHTVVEGVSAEVKNHPENTATREYNHYTFLTPPEDYHLITIVYKTNSTLVKAYTLGTRYSGTFLGAMSFVTGQGNSAEGFCAQAEGNYCHAYEDFSHAEGELTKARGKASHSEGDSTEANGQASHAQGESTIAYNRAQTVIGTYNIDNSSLEHISGTATHPNGDTDYGKYAFVIGNGTTWNAHSNALAVDWTGNIEIGIDTTASAGTVDGDLYAIIDTLGWTSDVID